MPSSPNAARRWTPPRPSATAAPRRCARPRRRSTRRSTPPARGPRPIPNSSACAASAEEAARIAQHAEEKAAFARDDLATKGKPYLDDPLFAYLWRRGCGTAAYRAGPLTRLLDGWVARVARYEPARRNYALLESLPAGLAGHAARMREQAAATEAALAARMRSLAGLPEGDELAAPREALDMAEAALEAAARRAEEARAALAGQEDAALREATARMEAALAAESLQSLRAAALRTPMREDDEVVARLEAAAAEAARLDRALAGAEAQAAEARRRAQEVARIREEMRSRGVRRDHWGFNDGALVGVLIGDLLRGTLSRDGFWDRLERQRVPPARPLGHRRRWRPVVRRRRPWSGGGWGAPSGRRVGTGGGFGGGGFRTGGGMDSGSGGGGFKTRRRVLISTGTSPGGFSAVSTKELRVSFTPGMRSSAFRAKSA